MSHWAEIKDVDGKKIVERVLVGDNNDPDEGYQWLIENQGGVWVKTSFNAATNGFRKNFAGKGYEWREDIDAFIPPQPFASWTLNEETAQWEAPLPRPEGLFDWDEEQGAWIEKPVAETPQA
jgi:hypothetical protein